MHVGANGRSPVHGDIQEQYADGSKDLKIYNEIKYGYYENEIKN